MYHSSLCLAHSLLTVPVAFTSASCDEFEPNPGFKSHVSHANRNRRGRVSQRCQALQAVLHTYIYVRLAGALAAAADVESSG